MHVYGQCLALMRQGNAVELVVLQTVFQTLLSFAQLSTICYISGPPCSGVQAIFVLKLISMLCSSSA